MGRLLTSLLLAVTSRQSLRAIVVYYTSSLLVVIGVCFGYDFVPRIDYKDFPGFSITQPAPSLLGCFANWDGVWYRDIAERGYSFDSREGSYVIFFPGYPCMAALISYATAMDSIVSLLLVSHVSFLFCIGLLEKYVRLRSPDIGDRPLLLTLLAFSFSPMSFFFRVAYAESLFCLLVLLTLYGVHQRWSLWVLAGIIGTATAVRLVGLALIPVLAMYIWDSRSRRRWRYSQLLALPFSAWGFLSYAAYLAVQFGDSTIFHTNQVYFNDESRMADSLLVRVLNLLTAEPIWSPYSPHSPLYWRLWSEQANPLVNLRLMNPVFFIVTSVMVVYGCWAKYLDRYECLVSGALLLVPYVTKGYDNAMLGHARYTLVVVPVFMVAGRLLDKTPPEVGVGLFAVSATLMTLFAALFAAWEVII